MKHYAIIREMPIPSGASSKDVRADLYILQMGSENHVNEFIIGPLSKALPSLCITPANHSFPASVAERGLALVVFSQNLLSDRRSFRQMESLYNLWAAQTLDIVCLYTSCPQFSPERIEKLPGLSACVSFSMEGSHSITKMYQDALEYTLQYFQTTPKALGATFQVSCQYLCKSIRESSQELAQNLPENASTQEIEEFLSLSHLSQPLGKWYRECLSHLGNKFRKWSLFSGNVRTNLPRFSHTEVYVRRIVEEEIVIKDVKDLLLSGSEEIIHVYGVRGSGTSSFCESVLERLTETKRFRIVWRIDGQNEQTFTVSLTELLFSLLETDEHFYFTGFDSVSSVKSSVRTYLHRLDAPVLIYIDERPGKYSDDQIREVFGPRAVIIVSSSSHEESETVLSLAEFSLSQCFELASFYNVDVSDKSSCQEIFQHLEFHPRYISSLLRLSAFTRSSLEETIRLLHRLEYVDGFVSQNRISFLLCILGISSLSEEVLVSLFIIVIWGKSSVEMLNAIQTLEIGTHFTNLSDISSLVQLGIVRQKKNGDLEMPSNLVNILRDIWANPCILNNTFSILEFLCPFLNRLSDVVKKYSKQIIHDSLMVYHVFWVREYLSHFTGISWKTPFLTLMEFIPSNEFEYSIAASFYNPKQLDTSVLCHSPSYEKLAKSVISPVSSSLPLPSCIQIVSQLNRNNLEDMERLYNINLIPVQQQCPILLALVAYRTAIAYDNQNMRIESLKWSERALLHSKLAPKSVLMQVETHHALLTNSSFSLIQVKTVKLLGHKLLICASRNLANNGELESALKMGEEAINICLENFGTCHESEKTVQSFANICQILQILAVPSKLARFQFLKPEQEFKTLQITAANRLLKGKHYRKAYSAYKKVIEKSSLEFIIKIIPEIAEIFEKEHQREIALKLYRILFKTVTALEKPSAELVDIVGAIARLSRSGENILGMSLFTLDLSGKVFGTSSFVWGKSCLLVGRVLRDAMQIERAREYFEKALNVFERLQNSELTFETHVYISLCLLDRFQFIDACQYLMKVLQTLNGLNDEQKFALLHLLGYSFHGRNVPEATETFASAHRLFTESHLDRFTDLDRYKSACPYCPDTFSPSE